MSSQTGGLVGPTGGMTMPTTGSLTLAGGGVLLGISAPGIPPGLTGQVAEFDRLRRIFTFLRSDGVRGIIVLAADTSHLAWMDENFLFGSMQKVPDVMNPPPVGPFADVDIQGSVWTGTMTGALVDATPASPSMLLSATIDALGQFDLSSDLPYTAMSTAALTFTDPAVGAFESSSYQDGFATLGVVHALMTPDKQFVAFRQLSGLADALDQTLLGAWHRGP
jgi:hypothetical protein